MNKNKIRAQIKELNLAVCKTQRKGATDQIITQLAELEALREAQSVAIFSSLQDEIDTEPIIEWLESCGKRVLLPRIEDKEMELYPIGELSIGHFGILEPEGYERIEPQAVDLIFVPGVAFTRAGARLGRGAGFYDRYLSREGMRAKLIGLCYRHQLLDEVPMEQHDKYMDMVIASGQ